MKNTTIKQKKEAVRKLLVDVNQYEVKQRKRLVGVVFDEKRKTAHWSGKAHNYTVNIE